MAGFLFYSFLYLIMLNLLLNMAVMYKSATQQTMIAALKPGT